MFALRQGFAHLRRHVRYNTSKNSINGGDAKMSQKPSDFLVWMDLEMTGLDPVRDKILEVACLITDNNLKTVSEEFHVIIHQSEEELNSMNSWCIKNHGKTGLTEACKSSTISNSDAELRLLSFLEKYIPKRACPLAGNSIYMDRMFLVTQMPLIHEYLHYRLVDVSSIKELARRWNPSVYKEIPKKNLKHRAMGDIKESIKELEFYQKHMFQ